MLQTAVDALLTPIPRMKENTMKDRLTEYRQGLVKHREMAVKALYQACILGPWDKLSGQRYQAKACGVELHLADSPKAPERWLKVRLLFVRGTANREKEHVGKHDWAVFLTTDMNLEPPRTWNSMRCAGPLRCISRKPSNISASSRSSRTITPPMSPRFI